ncbi:MAG: SPFH domain-containing protein [Aggregatilineales bacterium]|jgi:membrane protease subunit (stomatin/prohibitin family)|nr:SPFH domain-containing protein [Aggregatilineales bacterium]HPV08036.1 SPFH domain-containing protein [Aggregatilineales bacterium]HQE18878.1 SPFH domain-containing protein [Aggregatilineales bacterium]
MARIFDLVQHPNVGSEELAWREPQSGSGDFRLGSQVVVRENQAAVFVRGGKALDTLGPGTHTISTANVPILARVIGAAFNQQSPFTAEVYFINLQDFPQVGWGTTQPLALETPGRGLGWLLLQGHGVMDISISDPQRFAVQYAIGKPIVRISDIKERLLTLVLGDLQDIIATHAPGDLMGLNRMIGEIEAVALSQLREKFDAVGIRLKAFEMKPFSAAKTTAEDLRNMGLLDLATYQGLQAADALRDAARNEGGIAGAGVGLGAGMGLGQMMAGAFQQQQQQTPQEQSAQEPATPQTPEQIQALLDNLDLRLANGEISEAAYERLYAKWQKRLEELK